MFKKLLDKYYFKKYIETNFGLTKSDLEKFKSLDKEQRLSNLCEKMKFSIIAATLNIGTQEGLQRMNNWVECLEFIQAKCKESLKKGEIDYRTGKKKT